MYKKILMPVDVFEMDLSDKAVRHAANLAKAEGVDYPGQYSADQQPILLRGFNADIKKFEEYDRGIREENER
jgi:universal stress protein G